MGQRALAQLPLAFFWLAPELYDLEEPAERGSSCASCPLAGAPFSPTVRCCTYHPSVPNFLLGRALRRGGRGASRIVERLRDPAGRTAWGIRPPSSWCEEYHRRRDEAFGREEAWTCPYWVGGPLACGIWEDRNVVCRTWFCKHDEGEQGHAYWVALRLLAARIEDRLALLAAGACPAPPDDASPEVWAGYYLETAERVDRFGVEALAPLRDELVDLRDRLRQAHAARRGPMPDRLAPMVREVRERPDGVELIGYSPWNGVVFPRSVFALLAELDGERTWKEAVERARRVEPAVEASWVERLWRHGVIRARTDPSVPWGFEGEDLDPDELARQLSDR